MTISSAVMETAGHLVAAGIESGRREAEILVGHVTGLSRACLIAHPNQPLSASEGAAVRNTAARRARGEPLPYILGEWEFYGLRIEVTPAVLIPRPETETLVEAAIEVALGVAKPRVLDIGTGSGAIAIAIASHVPTAEVTAIDISPRALDVARCNARRLGVDGRIRFREGDLWIALAFPSDTEEEGPPQFDLIVANPPYIRRAEFPDLQPEVRDFEPRVALDGGDDGLAIIRRIVSSTGKYLVPGGTLMIEVGVGQAAKVMELCCAAGLSEPCVIRDLAGKDRVVVARQCG